MGDIHNCSLRRKLPTQRIHSTIPSERWQQCHRICLICSIMREYSDESPPAFGAWQLQLLETSDGQIPYLKFRDSLPLVSVAALDISVEEILQKLGNQVCTTKWGKSLGAGLYEFRINRSLSALMKQFGVQDRTQAGSDSTVLLRVFFSVEGSKIILLLSGYDKGKDSSRKKQQRLIKTARTLLKQHKKGD